MLHTKGWLPQPRSRSQSSLFGQLLKATKVYFIKLYLKTQHIEKFYAANQYGSHNKGQGHKSVLALT